MLARPVDSAIVAAREPCRTKCSVVTNVTAAGRGSFPPSSLPMLGSLSLAGTPPLDEPLDELERLVADLPPAAVDRERVPTVGDLDDLSDAVISLLELVGGVRDCPGDGVILLAGDDQKWSALWILGVDLGLTPGVEVRRCCLEERLPGTGHGVGLVELGRLVLAHDVGERVAELIVGERHRSVSIRGV